MTRDILKRYLDRECPDVGAPIYDSVVCLAEAGFPPERCLAPREIEPPLVPARSRWDGRGGDR